MHALRTDGSPHEPTCTNTGSGKTARETLARNEINPSDPVPISLVPQMIGRAIRRFGRQIEEIHVRQVAGNCYAVAVVTREGEE